jgi:hypothetical protein
VIREETMSRVVADEGGAVSGSVRESEAYRGGWRDGRFSPYVSFATNTNLALWEGLDRLAYYRGYREGLRVREMLAGF